MFFMMAVVQGSHQNPTFPEIAYITLFFKETRCKKILTYYRKIPKKRLQRLTELIYSASELLTLANISSSAQVSSSIYELG